MSVPTTLRRTTLRRTTLRRALAGAAVLAVLAGCGQETTPAPGAPEPSTAPSATPHDGPEEVEELAPRVLVAHEGGVLVLDSVTGEVLDDVPLAGVVGLSALDGRHVLVSTTEGHRVYDSGIEAEAHRDHAHFTLGPAGLTGDVVPGERAVTNAGSTALVAADGQVLVLAHHLLGNGVPPEHTWTAARSDAGLVVPLAEGGMLVGRGTEGGAEVALFDADGAEVAAAPCPGPSGAQGAAGGAVVVACADGPLVLADGALTRPAAEETPGTALLAGSPLSAVVLGGFDPGTGGAAPQRLSLLDTEAGSARTVELEAGYGPRSLARGPYGEGLVLTTDGVLRAIDDLGGEQLGQVDVGAPWSAEQPPPVLVAVEAHAYVADPATRLLHVVDLLTGQVTGSHELPHAPLDVTAVTGLPPVTG